jgi:hypothetical protein
VWLLYPTEKTDAWIFTKMAAGYILGKFFVNTSGRPSERTDEFAIKLPKM